MLESASKTRLDMSWSYIFSNIFTKPGFSKHLVNCIHQTLRARLSWWLFLTTVFPELMQCSSWNAMNSSRLHSDPHGAFYTNIFFIRRWNKKYITIHVFAGVRKMSPGKKPPGKMTPRKLPPGKLPPEKSSPRKLPPGKMPHRKIVHRKIAPQENCFTRFLLLLTLPYSSSFSKFL